MLNTKSQLKIFLENSQKQSQSITEELLFDRSHRMLYFNSGLKNLKHFVQHDKQENTDYSSESSHHRISSTDLKKSENQNHLALYIIIKTWDSSIAFILE